MAHPNEPDRREPDRLLALGGAVNFRDIGGYPTATGRRVAWRRLFRADSLDELTPADIAVIEQLDVRMVYDLRHSDERRRRPDRLPHHIVLRTASDGFNPDQLFAGPRDGRMSVDDIRSQLLALYRLFPSQLVVKLRPLMQDILKAVRYRS